ncbi:MAG TPA: GTPase HflX [Candidatus Krumholzibacteria bacterium]|nr:GTPase HflX [Candidatus Krumholzibacteria bacterium]HPD73002.1 GTPase HflX [Candidatus Krumholzibacteria bacterium]HRY41801.1 GTPase HflX [Candidatus Krumholzibacteria bacterium]
MGRTGFDRAEAQRGERAILVGVHLPPDPDDPLAGPADTEELTRLVDTAGGQTVAVLEQRLAHPNPATFLGKGKLAELKEATVAHQAELVVFDNDLAPNQGRNLQKALGEDVRVIDRTELILDIFATHARTRQATLQVELAQLQYALPRLRRLWKHLERQEGAIGTRGPGETQLETDRRLISRRIGVLRRQLEQIRNEQRTQTRNREGVYRVALVGYTNAGKSTLMNAITGAGVLVEDRLFATLDATTRRVEVDERRHFLLTDTVGFIRRLPHHLVESFRATLQEVADADLLVHVVDAGAADPEQQIEAVESVLAELVPADRSTLLVFNKLDSVPDRELLQNRVSRHHPGALFVSALEPAGGPAVRDAILVRMRSDERVVRLVLPAGKLYLLGPWHRTGDVVEQVCENGLCTAAVRMRQEDVRRLLARESEVREVPGP